MSRPDPTRRILLASLAASPVALAGAWPTAAQEAAAGGAGLVAPNVCVLAVETTAGPYYFDPGLVRGDITDGRPGLAMDLVLQVVDAACAPIAGARVDVWHCDATGNYSGYASQGSDRTLDTSAEAFLRGTQMTDARGVVTFRTIYPGWYQGRTTHVHHKVFLNESELVTGQVFFADDLSERVFRVAAPYNERTGARDTMNLDDRIAAEAGRGAYAAVRQDGGRLVASLVVGVDATR